MAWSIACVLELLDTCRTISFCWFSRVGSCDEDMLGCGGREASIAAASLDLATDEGSVSGSKSASKMRLSFAVRLVFGASIAMLILSDFFCVFRLMMVEL